MPTAPTDFVGVGAFVPVAGELAGGDPAGEELGVSAADPADVAERDGFGAVAGELAGVC